MSWFTSQTALARLRKSNPNHDATGAFSSASGGGSGGSEKAAKDAADTHEGMAQDHAQERRSASGRDDDKGERDHGSALLMHSGAADKYNEAAGHYAAGRTKEGDAAFSKAQKLGKKANDKSGKVDWH